MSDAYVSHHVVTPVHGRYLIRVAESPGSEPIRNAPLVVGFHGYAESAETHMARLEAIPGADDWTLVSIQGLHRFYGRDRQVVASWMTSQDRESAIEDNLRYVRSVVTEAIHMAGEPRALVYLGYSQGAAMAWRAALLGARRADGLVTFGGEVPPEFAVRPLQGCPPVILGRGRQDAWYPAAQFTADVDMLASRFVMVEPCETAGGHDWSAEFADNVGRFLLRFTTPGAASA
jgi:predicted esterase